MDSPFSRLTQVLDQKLSDAPKRSFYLAVWAGIYIAVGGIFYGIVSSFPGDERLVRLIAAFSFTIGLNLVIFKKAQLFTGNNLMIIGMMKRKIRFVDLAKNWVLVYGGNLIGSLIAVGLILAMLADLHPLGMHLQSIAEKKVSYTPSTAFTKAIYCNILVCTGIWFGVTARTLLKKVIGITIPITMFVYLGFEHSIANMFFIPLGLGFSQVEAPQSITLFLQNIIPVTLGNVMGGFIASLVILGMNRKQQK